MVGLFNEMDWHSKVKLAKLVEGDPKAMTDKDLELSFLWVFDVGDRDDASVDGGRLIIVQNL